MQNFVPEPDIRRAFQRQHFAKLGDLTVQAFERLVSTGQHFTQEKLRQREDHQQENNNNKQR